MDNDVYQNMLKMMEIIVNSCEICHGNGYLTPDNPGELKPCRCMIVHTYLCALIEARIPRDYWRLSLSELDIEDDFIKFTQWYIDRLGKAVSGGLGLLLMGPNGVGKTSLQGVIGKEAIVQGFTIRYYTAQQYIESRKMKKTDLTEDFESPQIILLDELDKVYISQGSDYAKRTLEDYLRRMTSERKALIIATNGDEDYLKKTFGDSTLSALARHLKFLSLTGRDYSNQLQDDWTRAMSDERSWFDAEIWDMAKRRMDRIQREYQNAW